MASFTVFVRDRSDKDVDGVLIQFDIDADMTVHDFMHTVMYSEENKPKWVVDNPAELELLADVENEECTLADSTSLLSTYMHPAYNNVLLILVPISWRPEPSLVSTSPEGERMIGSFPSHFLDCQEQAMFGVLDELGTPVCCGFFVSENTALTTTRGKTLTPGAIVKTRTYTDRPIDRTFRVRIAYEALDYAILDLVGSPVCNTWFTLPHPNADSSGCMGKAYLAALGLDPSSRTFPSMTLPPGPHLKKTWVSSALDTHIVFDTPVHRFDAGGIITRYSATQVFALAMIVNLAREGAAIGVALFLGDELPLT